MFKVFWIWDEEQYEELDVEIEEKRQEIPDEWQVALDIIDNSEEIIIVAPIAWVDLENIDISLKQNVLTISWERVKPVEVYVPWVILRNNECFWGKFTRNIIMPENLDFDNIKAILEKNVLIIKIAKLKFRGQNIKVNRVEDFNY